MRYGYLFISLLLLALTQSTALADTTNVTNNYYSSGNSDSYGPYGNGAEDYVTGTTDVYTTNADVHPAARAVVAEPVRRADVRAVTPGRVGVRR